MSNSDADMTANQMINAAIGESEKAHKKKLADNAAAREAETRDCKRPDCVAHPRSDRDWSDATDEEIRAKLKSLGVYGTM